MADACSIDAITAFEALTSFGIETISRYWYYAAMKKKKQQLKDSGSENRSRFDLRFADQEHHTLVKQAADKMKLSMNAWIVTVTIAEARRQLGE